MKRKPVLFLLAALILLGIVILIFNRPHSGSTGGAGQTPLVSTQNGQLSVDPGRAARWQATIVADLPKSNPPPAGTTEPTRK